MNVIANFRRPIVKNKRHLANLRGLPCVICGRKPCDAHHLMRTPEKGMGRRSGDRWAIPLCRGLDGHHQGPESVHANGNETVWFRAHGLDPIAIAEALWRAKESPEELNRIAVSAFQRV